MKRLTRATKLLQQFSLSLIFLSLCSICYSDIPTVCANSEAEATSQCQAQIRLHGSEYVGELKQAGGCVGSYRDLYYCVVLGTTKQ